MNNKIATVKQIRQFLLNRISELTTDQLNEIPAGFNNNIIWNLGHLVAAQQGICYVRPGIRPAVDEKYILLYQPGTKPEQYVDSNEVEIIKQLLITSLDQFETDYQNNLFVNYEAYTTAFGIELKNIDDAIAILPFHEGVHSGYIMSLRKFITKG